MTAGRTAPARKREWVIAAGGIASFLALAWSAWSLGDPDAGAAAASARRVSQRVEAVEDAWQRRALRADWPATTLGKHWSWTEEQAREVQRVTPPAASLDPPAASETAIPEFTSAAIIELYLSEAQTLELQEANPEAALERVLSTLSMRPTGVQLAEVRLRGIQLGARLERADVVHKQLEALIAETPLALARGGTSFRLLGGLAAGGQLTATERALLQHELSTAWEEDRLTLPGEVARVLFDESGSAQVRESGARLALEERVLALHASDVAQERFDSIRTRAALRALASALGKLPITRIGSWEATRSDAGLFIARSQGDGQVRGAFVDARELALGLEADALLEDGMRIDFDGDASELGVELRGRRLLSGDLGFVLRHPDPEQLARSDRLRLRSLRLSLIGLALGVAAAAFFSVRAMRSERKLAGLKSEFIAGVSHDLRTPLSSILLMAENLESGRVKSEERRGVYYGAIRREAGRLRRLVENVLDFGRLDKGLAPRIEREEVELLPFIQSMHSELAESCTLAGAQLELEAGELPAAAYLDAQAVQRAIANLVENALKHSGSSELKLIVRAEEADLCLAVADRGCGIARDLQKQVFEPYVHFAQPNSQRKGAVTRIDSGGNGAAPKPSETNMAAGSHRGGSGLGLAIVRELALAHGGSARVMSGAEGLGVIFELRLPLRAAEASEGIEKNE